MIGFFSKNWFWLIPLVLAVVVFFVLKPKQVGDTEPGNAAPPLRKDDVLYQGITGYSAEIKELQKWLGVAQDGIFGPKTAQSLYAKKGKWNVKLSEIYP